MHTCNFLCSSNSLIIFKSHAFVLITEEILCMSYQFENFLHFENNPLSPPYLAHHHAVKHILKFRGHDNHPLDGFPDVLETVPYHTGQAVKPD